MFKNPSESSRKPSIEVEKSLKSFKNPSKGSKILQNPLEWEMKVNCSDIEQLQSIEILKCMGYCALKLLWNCSETALKLLWDCSETKWQLKFDRNERVERGAGDRPRILPDQRSLRVHLLDQRWSGERQRVPRTRFRAVQLPLRLRFGTAFQTMLLRQTR